MLDRFNLHRAILTSSLKMVTTVLPSSALSPLPRQSGSQMGRMERSLRSQVSMKDRVLCEFCSAVQAFSLFRRTDMV